MNTQSMNQSATTVFVEQTLAWPGSANETVYLDRFTCYVFGKDDILPNTHKSSALVEGVSRAN